MLHRPVYIKAKPIKMAPIPIRPPPEPPREPTPPPPPPEPEEPPVVEEEPHYDKIPMLVCGYGINTVIPKEATRDVLSGRVPYYLVDDRGMTLFKPKHIFAALKLDKEHVERYEDYSCVGAHERLITRSRKHVPKEGLGYRRKFISAELIGRGIYVYADFGSKLTDLEICRRFRIQLPRPPYKPLKLD